MSQYGKQEYWEERFQRDLEPFDWYQRFSGIQAELIKYIQTEHKILNIGCGNSRLSEEMFDEGFQNITNIDSSATVIKQMNEKYKNKGSNFTYQQIDARAMEFQDGLFDVVIDKGLLDCILCGEGSNSNTQKMLLEVYRVMKSNSIYFIVSYGPPDHRLKYLQKPELGWKVEVVPIEKPVIGTKNTIADDKDAPKTHFLYICFKGEKPEVQ